MTGANDATKRRNVLRTLAAAGLAGAGVAASGGSASAQRGRGAGRRGRGAGRFNKLRLPVSVDGEIVEETDVLDEFEVGDDASFEGDLVLTELDVDEEGRLVASGRLKGTVSGNPTEQINAIFEDVVLGLLEDVLGLLSPDEAGECPILTLDVGEIFLDLLGLQVQTSVIEIDITAVAGEGNLLGNLLCAVAGLLDP